MSKKRLQCLREQEEELLEQLRDLEEEILQMEEEINLRDYVKVVCPNCYGTGTDVLEFGGADFLSDPLEEVEEECESCGSKGFLWAKPFTGKKDYDLEYSEISWR